MLMVSFTSKTSSSSSPSPLFCLLPTSYQPNTYAGARHSLLQIDNRSFGGHGSFIGHAGKMISDYVLTLMVARVIGDIAIYLRLANVNK